jgi:hypothetical protein
MLGCNKGFADGVVRRGGSALGCCVISPGASSTPGADTSPSTARPTVIRQPTGRRARPPANNLTDCGVGATWLRGRGFALHQALLIIPYYPDTNPAFVAMATRTPPSARLALGA